jgi:CASP C terminal
MFYRLEGDLEAHLTARNKSASGRGGALSGHSGHMELSELLGVDMGPSMGAGAQGGVSGTSGASSGMSIGAGAVTTGGAGAGDLTGKAAGSGAAMNSSSSSTNASSQAAAAAQESDASKSSQQMISILQTQRDRYKERLSQVESSLLALQQRLNTTEAAKLQLEQDNVALFAKIRYLQSVGPGGAGHNSRYGSKVLTTNEERPLMTFVSSYLTL